MRESSCLRYECLTVDERTRFSTRKSAQAVRSGMESFTCAAWNSPHELYIRRACDVWNVMFCWRGQQCKTYTLSSARFLPPPTLLPDLLVGIYRSEFRFSTNLLLGITADMEYLQIYLPIFANAIWGWLVDLMGQSHSSGGLGYGKWPVFGKSCVKIA